MWRICRGVLAVAACLVLFSCTSLKEFLGKKNRSAHRNDGAPDTEQNEPQREETSAGDGEMAQREPPQEKSFAQDDLQAETSENEVLRTESGAESSAWQEIRSVQDFYDDMSSDVSSRFAALCGEGAALPEWALSLQDDDTYFYALGISGRVTSEARSMERASQNAKERFFYAAELFLPLGAMPDVNGATTVSVFTKSMRNAVSGKQNYVSVILLRLPRSQITGN